MLCEGGLMRPLKETILPVPRLVELSHRFLDEGATPPFLKPEVVLISEGLDSWSFLGQFNVILQDDLSFHLAILKTLMHLRPQASNTHVITLFRLYASIYSKYISSPDPLTAQQLIR